MSANYGCKLTDIMDGTTSSSSWASCGPAWLRSARRLAMGFHGASIINAGRDSYNPCPNNKIGGDFTVPDAVGGDELQDGYLYATGTPPGWAWAPCITPPTRTT